MFRLGPGLFVNIKRCENRKELVVSIDLFFNFVLLMETTAFIFWNIKDEIFR